MNKSAKFKTISPNSRRSNPKRLLILLCFLVVLFVGTRFWLHKGNNQSLPPVDADSVAKTLRRAQLEKLANRNQGNLVSMQESLQRAKKFNLSDDALHKLVDDVERNRMNRDEHLLQALKNPLTTPLISQSPNSTRRAFRNRLVGLLIDDYEKNAVAANRMELAQQMRTLLTFGSHKFVEECRKLSETIRSDSDPLMTYVSELNVAPHHKKHSLQGFDGLKARKSSPLLGLLISMDVLSMPDIPVDSRGMAVEQFTSLFPETWDLIRGDREAEVYLMNFIVAYLSRTGSEANLHLLNTLEQSKIDVPTAAIHCIMGNLLEDIAWVWRGNSLAKHVSDNAWKEYNRFIDLAQNHYLAAWCEYPDVVGFSSHLLSMEMQTGKTGRSVDAWFRHGMSASNDTTRLLQLYVNASSSRWGGSNDQLIWLTGEILDCDQAGLGFVESSFISFRKLWEDVNDRSLMDQIDLVEPTLNIMDKLESMVAEDGDLQPEFAAMIAKILWDSAELRDLNFFMETFGKSLDASQCSGYRLNKEMLELISGVAVESSYDSWTVIHRELFLNLKNSDGGPRKAFELLNAMPKEGRSQRSIHAHAIARAWIERGQAFERGETVSLDFGRNGIDWASANQVSFVDDRTLEFHCDTASDPWLFKSLQRFAKPYSLQFELIQLDSTPDPLGVAFFSRPVSNSTQEISDCFELRVSPSIQEARFGIRDYWKNEETVFRTKPLLNVDKPLLVEVQVRKDSASFILNGSSSDLEKGEFDDFSPLVFGRVRYVNGIGTPGINAKYRISNLQIRNLKD